MKNVSKIALGGLLFSLIAPLTFATNTADMLLSSPASEVNQNEEFTVSININNTGGEEIFGAQVRLQYDPSVIEALEITPGPGLLIALSDIDEGNSQIKIDCGIFGDKKTEATVKVADISFKATTATTTTTSLQFIGAGASTTVIDGGMNNVLQNTNSLSISLNPTDDTPAPAPAPATSNTSSSGGGGGSYSSSGYVIQSAGGGLTKVEDDEDENNNETSTSSSTSSIPSTNSSTPSTSSSIPTSTDFISAAAETDIEQLEEDLLLVSSDGLVKVTIPAETIGLTNGDLVDLNELSTPYPINDPATAPTTKEIVKAYEIGLADQHISFSDDVTVQFPSQSTDETIYFYDLNNYQWLPVEGATRSGDSLTFTTNHFTAYATMIDAPTVTVRPADLTRVSSTEPVTTAPTRHTLPSTGAASTGIIAVALASTALINRRRK